MNDIYRTLYQDLSERGGLDIQDALRDGTITIIRFGSSLRFKVDPRLEDTWQFSTARLFFALVANRLRQGRSSSFKIFDEF